MRSGAARRPRLGLGVWQAGINSWGQACDAQHGRPAGAMSRPRQGGTTEKQARLVRAGRKHIPPATVAPVSPLHACTQHGSLASDDVYIYACMHAHTQYRTALPVCSSCTGVAAFEHRPGYSEAMAKSSSATLTTASCRETREQWWWSWSRACAAPARQRDPGRW